MSYCNRSMYWQCLLDIIICLHLLIYPHAFVGWLGLVCSLHLDLFFAYASCHKTVWGSITCLKLFFSVSGPIYQGGTSLSIAWWNMDFPWILSSDKCTVPSNLHPVSNIVQSSFAPTVPLFLFFYEFISSMHL